MFYVRNKNLPGPHPEKLWSEKCISTGQVASVLEKVKKSKHKAARRDHAAIFLGYHLALRAGEAAILDRNSFRQLEEGVVLIRTLKNVPKITMNCTQCHKRAKVSAHKAGKPHYCSGCGHGTPVPEGGDADFVPPEKAPPVVETHVLDYIRSYLEWLPKAQRWLFEGQPGYHLSTRMLNYIFSTYAKKAGLSAKCSWHALRHARGSFVWERFKDPVMSKNMLRHESTSASEIYRIMSQSQRDEYRKLLDSVSPSPWVSRGAQHEAGKRRDHREP